MAKIVVKHCRIEINNYELGDCPKLEYFFTIFDPVTHSYYMKGLDYDEKRKILILPRGLDVGWLEYNLNGDAKLDFNYDEFDYADSFGTAFLIGNEGNGLTDETASLADEYLKIPMEGSVESLNAAVAASVFMYEAYRQKRNNRK